MPSGPVGAGRRDGRRRDAKSPSTTTELLIESAEFDPLSIRNTARKLNLHSDSSYRFERGLDPEGVDWASRRCCELILELAGGELAAGVIDVGAQPRAARADHAAVRAAARACWASTCRPSTCARILTALGNRELRGRRRQRRSRAAVAGGAIWRARSTWSKKSPAFTATTRFPRTSACRWPPRIARETDRVLAKVRQVLDRGRLRRGDDAQRRRRAVVRGVQPLDRCARRCDPSTPVLRRADRLRRSLVPSLLGARQTNESLANPGDRAVRDRARLPAARRRAAARRADARR